MPPLILFRFQYGRFLLVPLLIQKYTDWHFEKDMKRSFVVCSRLCGPTLLEMHYIFPVCLISCCSALNCSPSHRIGVLSGPESFHGAEKILMPDIFRERNFCPYGVLGVRPDSPLPLSPLPFCGSGCIHFSNITKLHKPWLLVNKTYSQKV